MSMIGMLNYGYISINLNFDQYLILPKSGLWSIKVAVAGVEEAKLVFYHG